MTREEKQKAIDALKITAPVMVMTQEEFNDYTQTLNKIVDWLEQEPILDKIRAEIKSLKRFEIRGQKTPLINGDNVLAILDKYKAESEES